MNRSKVLPGDAQDWIKRCVVGNIRKAELDEERLLETNAMDMFCNSSIVYHTESILEMQIMMLLVCNGLHVYWNKGREFGLKSNYYKNDE